MNAPFPLSVFPAYTKFSSPRPLIPKKGVLFVANLFLVLLEAMSAYTPACNLATLPHLMSESV